MEHDDYLDDRCDYDSSMVMEIELKWNQLVETFRMNEFPVIGIDRPKQRKDKLWNEMNKITYFLPTDVNYYNSY